MLFRSDYETQRKLMPDKDRIYQAYIMYIDAQIAILEAKAARVSGEAHEAKSKEGASIALLSTLIDGKYAVSKYLVDKAKASLHSIEKNISSESIGPYESAN